MDASNSISIKKEMPVETTTGEHSSKQELSELSTHIYTSGQTSSSSLVGRVSSQPFLNSTADLASVTHYLETWVNEVSEERESRAAAEDKILYFLNNPTKSTLELSGTFSELPEVFHLDLINQRPKTTQLEIENCPNLKRLPATIVEMHCLRGLIVRKCPLIEELPPAIGRLKNLYAVLFSLSGLKSLPESIGELAQLKSINLTDCVSLKNLPGSIGECKQLISLIFTHCSSLQELPQEISQLKLKKFDLLGCTTLREISKEICDMQNSGTLLIGPCGDSLPTGSTLSLFPKVEDVELFLKKWVGKLPKSHQAVRIGIAKEIMHFLNSKESTLELHGRVSGLPEIFHSHLFVNRIKHLSLSHCRELYEIPSSVYQLKNLEVLNLSGTKIESLSNQISHLEHLQVLDLSGCLHFTRLPSTLKNMKSLCILDLQGCILLPASQPLEKRQIHVGPPPSDSRYSVLEDTPSCIVYEVTPGKKDPFLKWMDQSKQKGGTCWYYTLNHLRHRIGKQEKLSETHQKMREIEKAVSRVRKKITEYEKEISWGYEIEQSKKLKDWLLTIDQERAKALVNGEESEKNKDVFLKEFLKCYGADIEEFHENDLAESKECTQLYLKLKEFAAFPNEDKFNFHQFLSHDFLSGTQKLQNEYLKEILPHYATSSTITTLKPHQVDKIFLGEVARGYGLRYSAWVPDLKIDALIRELKQTGPIAVGGLIGAPYYHGAPALTGENFHGRLTYEWKEAARKFLSSGHMILLVGAKQEVDGEYVYYIDPNDESEVMNPETQRIYRMSYRELRSYIQPVGSSYMDKEGEGKPVLVTPYAYCKAA